MDIPWHLFDAPGAPWHPMDSLWQQLLASRGSPLAPHGHPLAATLALLCKRLENDQKNHYFELHFWCVFGKGLHAIRPRRRSPNPHFAHLSALHFETYRKAKGGNAEWTLAEAICDTTRRRGELRSIWEYMGSMWGDLSGRSG